MTLKLCMFLKLKHTIFNPKVLVASVNIALSRSSEETLYPCKRMLPEEKEEASTYKFNIRSQLNELVEEFKNVWDIGERQHKQRLFQFTEKENINIENIGL